LRGGYLGLGSNVGDREGHLRAAIEMLGEHGVEVEAVSSI
jgi:7,8-dihydro-6-hydroxymethylpterin-pyrophosphokinase